MKHQDIPPANNLFSEGQTDLKNTEQALLNILSDYAHEKSQAEDTQRALLNIMEDSAADKNYMEDIQRAVINILNDYSEEKIQGENTQRALLNIMEDSAADRNSLENLASIIKFSDDAIISYTLDGAITSWNKGAERMFGYAFDEIKATHVSILSPSNLVHEEEILINRIKNGEHIDHYETIRVRKDLTKVIVSITLSPVIDNDGNIIGISKVLRDISKSKEADEKLQETHRLKSEFLANMSHELRTPMNAVLGFSELLIDKKVGELNAKQLDYLKDIHASGSHLLQLINDVLDVSKIESGKSELLIESFSVQEVIEEVIKVLTPIAAKKNVKIVEKLSLELILVSADKHKFRQILYNLLSNGLKFNQPYGTVTIEAAPRGVSDFAISVSDTGIGIASENIRKLFIPFVQLDSGKSRQHEGSGLGLALVKSIVEMHGGEINVESILGQGSTFTIVLPLVSNRQPQRDG